MRDLRIGPFIAGKARSPPGEPHVRGAGGGAPDRAADDGSAQPLQALLGASAPLVSGVRAQADRRVTRRPAVKWAMGHELRVTEIFYSLQGETRTVGWPTVFVRLTGCPLRCHYCDTAYAFQGGERMAPDMILEKVGAYSPRFVTVTGGEPLAQPAILPLLQTLCDRGYEVSLETSGALSTAAVDPRVSVVLDLKTPGSGESSRNLYANVDWLRAADQVKFVITNAEDYEWARDTVEKFELAARCDVLFSPVHGGLEAGTLADWILRDRLPVRFQIQLHKVLWGDARGR